HHTENLAARRSLRKNGGGARLGSHRHRKGGFQHPTPHCFVGNVQPTLCREILHVPIPQRETQLQPDCVLDNRRPEPIGAHVLSSTPLTRDPVSVKILRRR